MSDFELGSMICSDMINHWWFEVLICRTRNINGCFKRQQWVVEPFIHQQLVDLTFVGKEIFLLSYVVCVGRWGIALHMAI